MMHMQAGMRRIVGRCAVKISHTGGVHVGLSIVGNFGGASRLFVILAVGPSANCAHSISVRLLSGGSLGSDFMLFERVKLRYRYRIHIALGDFLLVLSRKALESHLFSAPL